MRSLQSIGTVSQKSGQALKIIFYGCLTAPSHTWLSHRCIFDQWGDVGGVQEQKQLQLCIVIMFSDSDPALIRMRCDRLFQKYPAKPFFHHHFLAFPLILWLLNHDLHIQGQRWNMQTFSCRRGSNYPAPTLLLHSFRSKLNQCLIRVCHIRVAEE